MAANRRNGSSNLAAIVDELGSVKDQLRELQSRYDELRSSFDHEGIYAGRHYTVLVKHHNRDCLDVRGLRGYLPPKTIEQFTIRSSVKVLEVVKKIERAS